MQSCWRLWLHHPSRKRLRVELKLLQQTSDTEKDVWFVRSVATFQEEDLLVFYGRPRSLAHRCSAICQRTFPFPPPHVAPPRDAPRFSIIAGARHKFSFRAVANILVDIFYYIFMVKKLKPSAAAARRLFVQSEAIHGKSDSFMYLLWLCKWMLYCCMVKILISHLMKIVYHVGCREHRLFLLTT